MINEIICGDCVVIMKQMPDEFIDLTVTSPPYDNLRNYNGYNFEFKNIIDELYRITKKGGMVVWVVGDATIKGSETGTSFKQALYFKRIGFNLHDTMIYKSAKPPLTHNRYEQEFEYMFVFSKFRPKTFNPIKLKTKFAGDLIKFYYSPASSNEITRAIRQREGHDFVRKYKYKGNIWEYGTGMNGSTSDKIAFQHPAIFPEKLAEDHILSWSNEGDIVLDPMCGSGTTCKMAKKNNRYFIGVDISEEYCEIARKRLEPLTIESSLSEEYYVHD